ncbi:MAG: nucleoside deaminase [Bacillota bacterium]|nr:nucleoside deaminase [Bacillota bacterium]
MLLDNYFLKEAKKEAKLALDKDEVPVGAIIVYENKIISRAHNLKENLKDVTAHAEILAIRQAEQVLDNFRLTGCSLYVTLEPCPLCVSAIMAARIKNLYIGTFDLSMGACGSVFHLINDDHFNHKVNVKWLNDDECGLILSNFFKSRRGQGQV